MKDVQMYCVTSSNIRGWIRVMWHVLYTVHLSVTPHRYEVSVL